MKRSAAAPAVLVAALVLLAWHWRFVQDDAFISYRYARNLVDGHGLVFNPGERVEGYTNFLWTILMAAGIRLGVPVISWSHLLGLVCFAGSLTLIFLVTRRLAGSSGWGMLALCLAGTNYSFGAWATGGLETSLQTATVLLAACLALRALERTPLRPRDLAAFSAACAATLLTRLDSVLLVLAPVAALLWRVVRQPGSITPARDATTAATAPAAVSTAARRRCLLALILPGAVPLAAWFAWKAAYYGDLLPLTFYAKTGGALAPTVRQGARFLLEYLKTYWMYPQLVLLVVFARPLWRAREMRLLALGCGLWWLYVLWIGGDFMEFRLMTPVLPIWTICVLWVLARCVTPQRLRDAATAALVILALAGSWHHQSTFLYAHGIESVANLEGHLTVQHWDRVGQTLGRAFAGHEEQVTIAVTAAGAIPFYSGMRTVDMLGLNDPWIARHGIRFKTQPGHERTAPFRYLLERGVNLVIAHPLVAPVGEPLDLSGGFDLRNFRLFDAGPADLPAGARLIEIPIGEGSKVLVLYLVPNEYVEAALRHERWRSWPLAGVARL